MEPGFGSGFTRNHLLKRINSVIESLLILVNVFCFLRPSLWWILACGYGAGKRKHFSLPMPSMEADHVCSLCALVNKDHFKSSVLLKKKIRRVLYTLVKSNIK